MRPCAQALLNAIIDYAHANDVDHIEMGTHGRKGLYRTLIGSEAERILQNAAVPELTVNPYKVEVLKIPKLKVSE